MHSAGAPDASAVSPQDVSSVIFKILAVLCNGVACGIDSEPRDLMTPRQISRRTTLKFAGVITLAAFRYGHGASEQMPAQPERGYGTDPDLLTRPVTWFRMLEASQLTMLQALADIILPSDPPHPSAGQLDVHEFLDEWVSAPYPEMQADRTVILAGLSTLDATTRELHGIRFENAERSKQVAVFDLICSASSTAPFATRLIELVCGGYYTTREGHAAIGYVGNVGLTSFPGPPPEVVHHLNKALAQLVQK